MDNAEATKARTMIGQRAAAGLREAAPQLKTHPVLVGFDGFVDSIIDVVDKRQSTEQYDAVDTIEAFGQRIQSLAGQSANFELVTKLQKLGGNGPIMANALASAGLPVTYIGCLGEGSLHPVFEQFANHAEVYSIGDPGYTDALEFHDGKLMLGKHTNLRHVNYDRLCEKVGEDRLIQWCASARLLGMVNWTMLVEMHSIWDGLIERVLPNLPADSEPPLLFVDLADPAKRMTEDIEAALTRLSRLNQHAKVALGLNLNESKQLARVVGVPVPEAPEASIESTARELRAALGLQGVVVHPRTSAAGAWLDDHDQVHTAQFNGPFVQRPALSTGAGDNFNAGFCLGLLTGLDIEAALCVGTATSGYYVRNANSPTLDQLANFCDDLPDPEPSD